MAAFDLRTRSGGVVAPLNHFSIIPHLPEDRRVTVLEPVLDLLQAIKESQCAARCPAKRRGGSLKTSLVDINRTTGLWPFGQATAANYYTATRPHTRAFSFSRVGGNPRGGHAEGSSSPSAGSRPTTTAFATLTLLPRGLPLLHTPGAILGPQSAPVKEGGSASARNRPLDPGGWGSPPESGTRPLRIP